MAMTPYMNVLARAAGLHTQPIWIALDKKNRVKATWYHGCVQPWRQWRRAICGLGYRPVLASVTYYP